MKRIAVLASGRGSNLEAIFKAIERGEVAGEVVLVLSDRADAGALKRAERRGVKALFIDPEVAGDRAGYDLLLSAEIDQAGAELIVLAGYMRLLSSSFVEKYRWSILNVHPSLLPAFPGSRGIEDALAYGVRVSGSTVHFVDAGLDSGPVILQESLPLLQEDNLDTLRERIQAIEHRIYPVAIDLFCRGRLKVSDERCVVIE